MAGRKKQSTEAAVREIRRRSPAPIGGWGRPSPTRPELESDIEPGSVTDAAPCASLLLHAWGERRVAPA
jgi:hypothetical protein